jgi:predicted GH43/DUF377 family glycosyl hydrolase
MKWQKKGLLYKPEGNYSWNKKYGILPTPLHLPDQNIIRIYFASTNDENIGCISFLDVDESDPSKILFAQKTPILLEGDIGTFDDSGCNPASIIKINNQYHLYYFGYQRTLRVPYLLLSGVAVSDDAVSFRRLRITPILERTDEEPYVRSAPAVIADNNCYRMWYVSAFAWEAVAGIHNKLLPNYLIKSAHSADGINWTADPGVSIDYEDENEFGFGRPWVVKNGSGYRMWYSVRRRDRSYRIGYAESVDGVSWVRMDSQVGIDVSQTGWDSEMICYAAVITVRDKTYMFYNGNANGLSGFGYAELLDPEPKL